MPDVIFSTVTTLRANTNSTYDLAEVQGYTNVGDGGGGLFYWNSSDTTSLDNNGTIFTDSCAPTSHRWYRIIDGQALSVKWFGATDTGADSRVAINNTIAYAINNNIGTVVFPFTAGGAYHVFTTIGNGIQAVQSGSLTDLTLDFMNSTLVMDWSATPLAALLTCEDWARITIRNAKFDVTPPLFTQGSVYHVDSGHSYFDVAIDTGFGSVPSVIAIYYYDKTTDAFANFGIYSTPFTITHLIGNNYRVTCSGSFTTLNLFSNPGGQTNTQYQISTAVNNANAKVVLEYIKGSTAQIFCQNNGTVHLENIEFRGGGHAMNIGRGGNSGTNGPGDVFARNVHAVPNPNALLSTCADFWHLFYNRGIVDIANSTIRGTGDDMCNIGGSNWSVTSNTTNSVNVVCDGSLHTGGSTPSPPLVGDIVIFKDASMVQHNPPLVVTSVTGTGTYTIGFSPAALPSGYTSTAGWEVTHYSSLPQKVRMSDMHAFRCSGRWALQSNDIEFVNFSSSGCMSGSCLISDPQGAFPLIGCYVSNIYLDSFWFNNVGFNLYAAQGEAAINLTLQPPSGTGSLTAPGYATNVYVGGGAMANIGFCGIAVQGLAAVNISGPISMTNIGNQRQNWSPALAATSLSSNDLYLAALPTTTGQGQARVNGICRTDAPGTIYIPDSSVITVDAVTRQSFAINCGGTPVNFPVQVSRNAFPNGALKMWQRGTAGTGITASTYLCDECFLTVFSGSSFNWSQVVAPTSVPGLLPFYLELTNPTVFGSGTSLLQFPINDVRSFSGQQVTITIIARAPPSHMAQTYNVRTRQIFSTGGTPVDGPTLGKLALSASWQTFQITGVIPSVVGMTIGSGSALCITIGIAATALEIDLAGISINTTGNLIDTVEAQIDEALCKGLFERIQADVPNEPVAVGFTTSTTSATFILEYDDKASLPTISSPGTSSSIYFGVSVNGGSPAAVTLAFSNIGTKRCQVTATIATLIWTANANALLIAQTQGSSYIDVSAELI